jgi:hypothetical protein
VVDPDGRRVKRFPPPDPGERQRRLIREIDAGLPAATTVLLEGAADHQTDHPGDGPGRLPFITDSFLRTAVAGILRRYGSAFGAGWHADPERLRTEAVAMLERFGAVAVVPGGVLVRPLVGRYRNTVAEVRRRAGTGPPSSTLF